MLKEWRYPNNPAQETQGSRELIESLSQTSSTVLRKGQKEEGRLKTRM